MTGFAQRRRVLALTGVAAVGAIVVLGAAALLGGTRGPAATPDGTRGGGVSISPSGELPNVAPLRACRLLSGDEVVAALGLLELPVGDRDYFATGTGEGCTWVSEDAAGDAGATLRITPGAPGDFDVGANLGGQGRRDVTGVGAAAVWFAAPNGGTLSVVERGELGFVFVRVSVDRPDLDDNGHLELATDLAAAVLPRFPGVSRPEIEPETVTFAHEPPDRSDESLAENLLVKEADGEWTRAEGLLATLRLMTGEAAAADVLRHDAVAEVEATGIIELAREFLEGRPSEPESAEIAELLDHVVPTNERLEGMAGIGQLTAALPWSREGVAQAIQDCDRYFGGDHVGIGACLEFQSATIRGKEYRVFYPAPPLPSASWTAHHYDLAMEAMRDTVPRLSVYGTVPAVNLVFSVLGTEYAYAVFEPSGVPGEPCAVAVDVKVQPFSDADLKQVIAHELGHCFNGATFGESKAVPYEFRKWWDEGLSDYLSNLVYRDNDLEHRSLDKLAAAELSTTLFDRSYTNSIFFQHLDNRRGIRGTLDLVRSFATAGGRAEQEAVLAAAADVDEDLQTFDQQMTDARVRDTSGREIDYAARVDAVAVDGRTIVLVDPVPFGVVRLHVVVPPGRSACVEYDSSGVVRSSWRPGAAGRDNVGGRWDDELPSVLEGESVFAVTAISAGAQVAIDITEVSDDGDCEEDDPGSGPGGDCGICGPSDYYRLPSQLPEWFRGLVSP